MNINHTKLIYGAMLLASVFLTACGGGGGGGATTPTPATTYTIGGTVSGLTGTGLVLQNNGGNNLSVSAGASTFTFSTAIANGTAYSVTVLTQPTGQICTPSSNTGTVSGANVTSVSVTCSSSTHTIGGTISGLTGGTVVLQNNGGDNLSRSANGSFTFSTPVAHNAPYAVTVLNQPAGQRCTVSFGTGFAIANVTGITVNCVAVFTVSVNVTGLGTSRGLKMQNTGITAAGTLIGNENLAIPANGTYIFIQKLAAGDTYNMKVFIQPAAPALTCTPTGAGDSTSGTMPASTITVNYACAAPLPVFAYVANLNSVGNNISAYTITAGTGVLVAVSGSPFAAGTKPQSVAVAPSGKFAYVANLGASLGAGDISAFAITAGTGALTQINCAGGSTVCNYPNYKAGSNPQAITVDSSGRFVYAVNGNSDDISAYTINAITGALTPIDANAVTAGIQNFATGSGPTAISLDHSGQFAYVTNANDGSVSAYTINATTGALTRINCGAVAGCNNVLPALGKDFLAGTGPQSIDIDPTSAFVYVANASGNSVSAYTINATTGALTQINCGGGAGCSGADFLAGTAPTSVATDPTGNYVYVANKDPASNNVSAFSITPVTGALTAVVGPPASPYAAGTAPTSVAADLSGTYVYVANFTAGGISAYSSAGGALTPLATSPFTAGANPACITTAVVY